MLHCLQSKSLSPDQVQIVRLNLLDAFLHMSRSRGHVSYKSKKMRDLHIFFLQKVAESGIVRFALLQSSKMRFYLMKVCLAVIMQILQAKFDAEQWLDRVTEAIMNSIRAFKKWRKEAELAGVENNNTDKGDNPEPRWYADLPSYLSNHVRHKIEKARVRECWQLLNLSCIVVICFSALCFTLCVLYTGIIGRDHSSRDNSWHTSDIAATTANCVPLSSLGSLIDQRTHRIARPSTLHFVREGTARALRLFMVHPGTR